MVYFLKEDFSRIKIIYRAEWFPFRDFCQIVTFLIVDMFINCFYTFINIWYSCQLLVFSWTLWLKYQLVVPVICNFADFMREFQIVFKYCYSNRLTCFPKQAWNFAIKYSKHGTWNNMEQQCMKCYFLESPWCKDVGNDI